MGDIQQSAALNLQAIIEEERAKREEAEKNLKAIIEEFQACSDFEEVRQKFRERIKMFAPQALSNIVDLANHAESESVRANLNKWIIEWAMSDKIDGTESEIKNLIKTLKKTPSPAPAPATTN